ncbi:MAG: AAA family ATPase, partial [Solirubrobacteraceae bacterium]
MLLGRERERQRVYAALDRARAGASEVLALVGEPGIGKTALLQDAAGHADGMRVLRARGVESEARIPFASLLELLRPALGNLGRIP